MAIYNKTAWANNITPLNQENMNHIENGIYTVSTESYTSCSASYSEDTLQLIFKNTGNQQLGEPINVPLNTSSSLASISYNTSTYQLSYTTRGGASTNVLKVYNTSKVYTKDEINTTLADYYTKTEIDTTLGSYYTKSQIDTTLASYYTKSQIDTTLGGYYLKTEIDTLLANYYTKSQIDTLLNNYYTKTQINDNFQEIEIEED